SVVAICANRGTFKKQLFSNTKLNLEKTAKHMANINFQLKSKCMNELVLNRLPEIKFLSPINTMDAAVNRQYKSNQRKICKI
ncbi:hypothetical protein ABTH23_20190, partial [Acinetobacter baumannii]